MGGWFLGRGLLGRMGVGRGFEGGCYGGGNESGLFGDLGMLGARKG